MRKKQMPAGNVNEVNREILRSINEEILLKATKFANTLLSSNFRSIFRIPQSFEITEPTVYQLGDDPNRILWSRVSAYQARVLPLAISREEIKAKCYQIESEYEFAALVDISRSMMLNWWKTYGAPGVEGNEPSKEVLSKSKLYLLKYILVSFLIAAKNNGFIPRVSLFGGEKHHVGFSIHDEPEIEKTILTYIDQRFKKLAKEPKPEGVSLPDVLRKELENRRRRIILCLSDFTDGINYCGEDASRLSVVRKEGEIISYFTELGYKYRFFVIRINDRREVTPSLKNITSLGKKDTPYFNTEANPDSGDEHDLDPDSREEFVRGATLWYKKFDRKLQQSGVILGAIETGQEINKMLNRISALQGRI